MKYGIIAVGQNCAKNLPAWHKSIVCQSEKDFVCVAAIDPSKDNSLDAYLRLTRGDSRFKLIYNKNKNCGAARNRYKASKYIDNPEAILMHIDLDDMLFGKHAIRRVKEEYDNHKCWMTYGSFKTQDGKRGRANKEIPGYVWKRNSHRQNKWSTSALRTCKKWLWDCIKPDAFKLSNGKWVKRATDFACMFPMLEISGKKRVRYIHDIIYVYNHNDRIPFKEGYVSGVIRYLRSRKPYVTLPS